MIPYVSVLYVIATVVTEGNALQVFIILLTTSLKLLSWIHAWADKAIILSDKLSPFPFLLLYNKDEKSKQPCGITRVEFLMRAYSNLQCYVFCFFIFKI